MQFQKIFIPTPRRVTENFKGGGSQKPKFLKESINQNWNFQRGGMGGGGLKPKKLLSGRGTDLFCNNVTYSFCVFIVLYIFVTVWADNADACSVQYAGTGALKTDFTR